MILLVGWNSRTLDPLVLDTELVYKETTVLARHTDRNQSTRQNLTEKQITKKNDTLSNYIYSSLVLVKPKTCCHWSPVIIGYWIIVQLYSIMSSEPNLTDELLPRGYSVPRWQQGELTAKLYDKRFELHICIVHLPF